MNRKIIKEKTSKQNFWISFRQSKNTASAGSISLYCKCTTLKILRYKAECKGAQGKHVHLSRNIKAWQHSAGTSKQIPKSKTQIALGQLAST